jgi:hypothetical protein
MKTGRRVLVLALALVIASPVLAAEKKKTAKAPKCPAQAAIERMTKDMTISPEQKTKFEAIQKEFGPKLMEGMKKRNEVIKPEQQAKYSEARKTAEAAGKKGKELKDAVEAAMGLDADQKAKLAEIEKENRKLYSELQKAAMEVLTPEQKDQLKKAAKKPAK